jgi:GntR family transcriptional regulator, rspAB operon transcriptional repressor
MGEAFLSHGDPLPAGAARKPGSKAGLVYDELRTSIVALKLQPGAQIDKAEICGRLGVSRQPVSEALARLAEERLVTVEPQKGTYVTRIRMSDVKEAAFVREALEVATVRSVARDMDDATLDRLKLYVEYQSAAAAARDIEEFYALDVRFHATIFGRLAYRRVAEVVESARSQTERIRRLLLPKPHHTANTIVEHEAILDGLSARDPERAAQAMHRHLSNVLNELHKFAGERPDLFEL